MKKVLMLVIFLSMMLMVSVSTASAYHDWHHDSQPYDRGGYGWQHNDRQFQDRLPFGWHENYYQMREHHRFEAIHDRDWDGRFPGLHAYRWYGNNQYSGFWCNGIYVRDAVFFFDNDNQLAGFGYFRDGVFIMVREDNQYYENRDEFFFSWWNHRHYR